MTLTYIRPALLLLIASIAISGCKKEKVSNDRGKWKAVSVTGEINSSEIRVEGTDTTTMKSVTAYIGSDCKGELSVYNDPNSSIGFGQVEITGLQYSVRGVSDILYKYSATHQLQIYRRYESTTGPMSYRYNCRALTAQETILENGTRLDPDDNGTYPFVLSFKISIQGDTLLLTCEKSSDSVSSDGVFQSKGTEVMIDRIKYVKSK